MVAISRHYCCKNSATGTRARVARVRAEYPNQLDYSGSGSCAAKARAAARSMRVGCWLKSARSRIGRHSRAARALIARRRAIPKSYSIRAPLSASARDVRSRHLNLLLGLTARALSCAPQRRAGARGIPMSLRGRGWRSRNPSAPAGSWPTLAEFARPCKVVADARGAPMSLRGRG